MPLSLKHYRLNERTIDRPYLAVSVYLRVEHIVVLKSLMLINNFKGSYCTCMLFCYLELS